MVKPAGLSRWSERPGYSSNGSEDVTPLGTVDLVN
jgi:hypothetical protein